jgi:hypothetical protein
MPYFNLHDCSSQLVVTVADRVPTFDIARSCCESAPKWAPFSSPGKHLISARKFLRGGVRVGADRDPYWRRAFSVRSATYDEIGRGPTSVLIHT